MSSGRSWSYQVVSAEELRRRALAAARARLERANQGLAELEVAVAAAAQAYGTLDVSVPAARVARGGDAEAVTQVAAEVEAEVASTRARVEAAVAEARAGEIDRVTADLLGKMQPVSSLPALTIPTPGEANRTTTTPADPPAAKQIAAAGRVMARLPGDAGDEVVHRCRRLVAEIGEAPTAERGELLVAALRQEVQRANERHDLVASNRAEIERLSRQLDGLDAGLGPDPDGPVAPGGGGSSELDLVRSLRGHLRGVALDVPLPADLADRVERARAAAAAAQDRRFALEVTRDVFEEQGYDLGEDFVTVVATDQGAMLPLAASRRHGVRVREAAGRVSFEVVRFGRTNGGLDDVAAATAFCHSVDAMVERAGRGGLGIADRVYVPPSEGRVVLLDQESPFPEVVQEPPRRRPQQHERQRQR